MGFASIETERNMMTEFWREHSKSATVEEMMLDSNAQELTQHELPEILAMLPSLADSDVLELGAGIGSVITLSLTLDSEETCRSLMFGWTIRAIPIHISPWNHKATNHFTTYTYYLQDIKDIYK